jgi:cell wall-associated NlpC family hydrolase
MIERRYESSTQFAQSDLDIFQQRANAQRYRHRQVTRSFRSVQGSIKPFLDSPVESVRRLPTRYILHTVVALSVPVALGLSRVQIRPTDNSARTAVISEAPLELGPLHLGESAQESVIVGDPPIRETEAIPVPLSLTSRSEALAPPVVAGSTPVGTSVKLRNGPGLEYDEVSRVSADTPVEVVGRYGEWLQVREGNGADLYWVSSEMVEISEGAIFTLFEVREGEIPPPPPPKVGTVLGSGLNLRDGPGVNYVGMTTLESGQTFDLVEQYQDWVRIAGDGIEGWVHASNLDIASGVIERVPATETIPDANPPLVGVASAETINLRKGPGTAYEEINTLGSGDQVNLIARYGDWYKIGSSDGSTAWVFGDLLDVEPMAQRRVPATNDIPALPQTPLVAQRPAAPAAPGSQVTPASPAAPAAPGSQVTPASPANPGAPGSSMSPASPVTPDVPMTTDTPAAPAAPGAPTAPEVPVLPTAPGAPAAPEVPTIPGTSAPAAPESSPLVPASGDVAGFAMQFVGYPYIYGGASPSGFDCSGLVQYVYAQYGVHLPHNAAAQFSTAYGVNIEDMSTLAPGDVVFFANTSGPGITHVGIYIGGGRLVHAMMPGLGVQVSNLYESYWISHYAGAIRPYR